MVMLRTIMLSHNEELLEILLKSNADINFQDKEGRTALFLAVKYNRTAMLKVVIRQGCDVNLGKFNQSNALHLAAKKGHVSDIELLVGAGHTLDGLNWGGNTALLIACRFGHASAVNKLISYGANVNICNKLGHYPLHYAAFAGDTTLVQILMNKGANPDVRTHLGINPIMLACERKHCNIVSELGSQCDLHYREQLYGGTVLHWAIASGCCHCVDCLLTQGASLKITDSSGRTPVLEAVQSHQPKILSFLLDKHESEDFADDGPNGRLVHLAAFLGQAECVEIICSHAKTSHLLYVKDSFGETSLDLALKTGNKETVQVILKHGAKFSHIVQMILKQGENLGHTVVSGGSDTDEESPQDSSSSDLPEIKVDNMEQVKDRLTHLCLESTHSLRDQTHHKIFKTYSAIKMGMIDMLRSAPCQQMVAPVKFDFNTWLDNGPEAFVLKVTSLDLTNWLHQRMHTPWGLRELCRGCIRRHLGYRASDKVELLNVPPIIKEYLNMKELEEIGTSDIQIRSTGAFDDIDIE